MVAPESFKVDLLLRLMSGWTTSAEVKVQDRPEATFTLL